jgi:hypothetical protein
MSGDYSRKTFKASRNYSGVLMQQGRVQLDADWNEQIDIKLRRQRVETVDTLGRAVVPMETPDGFKIELNSGELTIFPGRMYVDGLLAENHGASPELFYAALDEERGTQPLLYQDQPFFPNAQLIEPLPTSGTHIAFLDVWQRELSYIQQPNLVEPAVGVDTTARWQTVWQVKVLQLDPQPGSELECSEQHNAWDDLIAPSAGRLSTAIVAPQEEDDLCLVPTEGGYRALENRLYRVEVHDKGGFGIATFKWARHNASIETAVNEISGTELVVAQSQWDESRRFNQDDWVEITDDVLELAGQAGEMRRISAIDYAANTITLNAALPALDFPVLPTNATEPERHTRIKRWDQQNEVDVNTGLLTISNTPVYMEAGIQISFSLDADPALSGNFKTGDYWLFYARSANASIEILDAAPAEGIHHHYARLAVLNFPDEQEDCRNHWPPEFCNSCCCSVTVGDGEISHGQYTSVQEAINQLPLTGGKVCLLPGIYQETILIQGKTDITISGCGDRTRLMSVDSVDDVDILTDPVVTIENSKNIRIESLSIAANHSAEGIHIRETARDPDDVMPFFANQAIELLELTIQAGERSAIRCDEASSLHIQDCTIRMRDVRTEWPGIFVIGTEVLIENNLITTESSRALVNAGRGGIQIGGNAEQVRVLNNHIKYGLGDGVTLGSLSRVDNQDIIVFSIVASVLIANDPCDPCAPPPVRIPPRFEIDDDGNDVPDPSTFISAGSLYDIVIENNRIEDMGRNGIGVVGFFDLDETDEFISIENLHIGHNHIEGCLSRTLPVDNAELEDDIGYGGIALADVLNLLIHNNDILNNGRNHIDPICGIYVLHGEGVEICDNRIINNGVKSSANNGDENRGARSGIHLVYAITPTVSLFPDNQKVSYPRQNGVPAAKVHNNVVSHPVGRALTINALGPVSVTDNQLTSRGVVVGQASAIASTVAILNLGVSNEFYLQLAGFAQIAKGQVNLNSIHSRTKKSTADGATFARAGLDDFKIGRYLANGNVLFASNQVVLDEFDTKINIALSAVTIMSLDDIAFHDNQCDYSLWGDFLIFPNFIFAPSVRVADNRFKESFYGAFISAVSFGLMNTTTGNQATHCLLVVGNSGLKVDEHNIVLADSIMSPISDRPFCELLKNQVRKIFNLGERL